MDASKRYVKFVPGVPEYGYTILYLQKPHSKYKAPSVCAYPRHRLHVAKLVKDRIRSGLELIGFGVLKGWGLGVSVLRV